MKKNSILAGFVLASALAGAWPAQANEDLEFNLLVGRHNLGFDYETDVETRYTRLGVAIVERSYRYVHGGFRLAVSDLNQSGNPPTNGLAITGGMVGVVLRSDVPLGAGFGLYAQTTYDYHTVDGRVENETENQRVELDWFDFGARVGLSARLAPITLRAGPYYRHVDGDETDSGDIDRTRRLEANESAGGFFDLVYRVERSGWMTLRLERGSRDGAMLTFTRLFE